MGLETMLLCASMVALSVIFWIMEIYPFLKTCALIKEANAGTVTKIINVVQITPIAIPFIIDLTFTLTILSLFGLTGVFGAAMSFLASNIISIAILIFNKTLFIN